MKKSNHGGYRPNAGRKPKFGKLPTKRVLRIIPVAWVAEMDQWLKDRLARDTHS